MNAKIMNLPKCFNEIKRKSNRLEFERIIYGFYNAQNYSIHEIYNSLYLNGKEMLKGLNLNEKVLINSAIVTCTNLKNEYDFGDNLCVACDFNNQKIKSKDCIPLSIRESMILNLAQQNNQVLQAIDPEKLISLAKIGGKYVKVYKEFYYYLKEENFKVDSEILEILKRIYFANEEMPANIKDINLLLDYIFESKIYKIKMLNKNFRQPIKIAQSRDIQQLNPLTTTNYIALDFRNDGRVMVYAENSSKVYDLNLLNCELVEYMNNILGNRGIKTIVKNIEMHNTLIQYKLTVRNLIPMDIIYSSLNLNNKNLSFESLINEFLKVEKNVDVKLLSFITFSLNTNQKIKVEDIKDGFFKIKALAAADKSNVIEFNTKLTIDGINNNSISYKEFYYNLAYFINKYANNHNQKHSNKIKFNVIEISDKFIVSTNKDIEKYVLEIIILAYREVIRSLSPNELEKISFKFNDK